MRSFRSRLRHLESIGECSECPPLSTWEVVWDDGGDDNDSPTSEDDGPEFCPACGRRLVFTVVWRDISPEDPLHPDRGEGGR